MQRGNLDDLSAFLVVAPRAQFHQSRGEAGRFAVGAQPHHPGARSAAGLRLLTRTTRSVSPTEAGERLLHMWVRGFEEIEAELAALSELREKPAGTIRITATEYAADTILLAEARDSSARNIRTSRSRSSSTTA